MMLDKTDAIPSKPNVTEGKVIHAYVIECDHCAVLV